MDAAHAAGTGESVQELFGKGQKAKHSLALVEIAPGGSSRRHYHPAAEESYHILEGTARFVLDEEETTLGPGDTVLIPPPREHQIFNSGKTPLRFLAACVPPWTPDCSVFTDEERSGE